MRYFADSPTRRSRRLDVNVRTVGRELGQRRAPASATCWALFEPTSALPRDRWPELSRLLDERWSCRLTRASAWLAAQEAPPIRRRVYGCAASRPRRRRHRDGYLERPQIERATPTTTFSPACRSRVYHLVRELGTAAWAWFGWRSRARQLDRDVLSSCRTCISWPGAVRERFTRERKHPRATFPIPTSPRSTMPASRRQDARTSAPEHVDGENPSRSGAASTALHCATASNLMRQVTAVEYAHAAARFVHRDLKPLQRYW